MRGPRLAAALPRVLGLVLALGLAGCVTSAPRVAGGLWTGRLAVRADAGEGQPARSSSGQFELSGSERAGQLVLTSPIGTVVARARWDLHGPGTVGSDLVELDTGGGPRRYATLDAMMVDALGDALPLAAMFDWLAGRPWPGAPAQAWPAPRHGFSQLGWNVDLAQLGDARLIVADRPTPPPALQVRVKLDAPDTSATPPVAPPDVTSPRS